MRLGESNDKDFLFQLVVSRVETAAALEAVAEVILAAAACKVAAEAVLLDVAAAEAPMVVVWRPTLSMGGGADGFLLAV
jgi:hypothetical protein